MHRTEIHRATAASASALHVDHAPTQLSTQSSNASSNSPVLQAGENDSPNPQSSAVTARATQAHGLTGKVSEGTVGSSLAETSPAPPSTKEALKVSWNFTQTLMKRLPDIVDGNPVKMALSLAKMIIQIKDVVKENMDAVERRIASTGAQLAIVEKAYDDEKNQWMKQFKSTLESEIANLVRLSEEWLIRKVADHENEKGEIAAIFERVNEARILFELGTGIAVFKIVDVIQNDLKHFLGEHLKVSRIADHKYHLAGEEGKSCGGMFARLEPASSVFWLFGPAGSGKSSIAYTIARRFELTCDVADTITLGGNFFCSRQFSETRSVAHIVRTIVYHLSLKCEAFANVLHRSGKFDTVYQGPRAQLRHLLVGPWVESQAIVNEDSTTAPHYLIVIDALDEVENKGGSEFLRALLDVINENHLPRLKFFVTSRSDPDLVAYVDSFDRKQLYRLQDVEKEEVEADIETYLATNLPHFVGQDEMMGLVRFAAGLFICAATLAKYLTRHTPPEQSELLENLLHQADPETSLDATHLLDTLYRQILSEAFGGFKGAILKKRLATLYTFLCTAERTSTSTATTLLIPQQPGKAPAQPSTSVADDVLSRLCAVLYCDNLRNILSYHKSFPDFMFDQHRSKEYWCDQATHHRHLTEACFQVMKTGLKFNIADIPSSFIFDAEDDQLPSRVERNIPPALIYSSRNWSHHLSLVASTASDEPLLETLADFLRLRALFWIEAMNLLKVPGLCDPMLRAARGGMIRVWDASTGKVQSLLEGHTERVGSVAFSSDGTRIASGSYDESVRVWDVSTGKVQSVLEGHTSEVNSVAFSSDGTCIASSSNNESMQVWVGDLQAFYKKEVVANSNDNLTHTGWLLSLNGTVRLMFVPLAANLPDPPTIIVLSSYPSSFVYLTNANLGEQ
ncbi:hypothetical protein EST38_g11392 [Candolleomyces aberdarensis]|uniref:NACHT domain-containing protein n=1 Tax=Candolleomyces aberdarensis TaxID=2316362 RepID=A0A4Q2D7P7_9AGAR|nr:hypothetical protein EST38_g11392 [Candolleomyces aberdarensis]